jgi:cobalt transporter subunit CbtB
MTQVRSHSAEILFSAVNPASQIGLADALTRPERRAEAVPEVASDERAAAIARVAPALATIALGMVVLFCVGFLQTPAVHNGVHDTRHANGFPCH